MALSADGYLLATASEQGTVIRVHIIPQASKVFCCSVFGVHFHIISPVLTEDVQVGQWEDLWDFHPHTSTWQNIRLARSCLNIAAVEVLTPCMLFFYAGFHLSQGELSDHDLLSVVRSSVSIPTATRCQQRLWDCTYISAGHHGKTAVWLMAQLRQSKFHHCICVTVCRQHFIPFESSSRCSVPSPLM